MNIKPLITVLEVTFIATEDGGNAEWIGLWYTDGRKAGLNLFSLDRTDLLSLENGDKGRLVQQGDKWDFEVLGN